ncbi:Hypothetical predicted protein [Pelobates cultripes]|uniref:C-type lectin domain-containing protein n=2 Tax=Pelobates cultripes TaxID=61616 RepID=A0AAD1SCK3_PELCU|nr:Hypothetical predicted protein [Pelobates cultripes]
MRPPLLPPVSEGLKGFLSIHSQYLTVFLLGFCLLLLVIIIGISTHLSSVSQHRDYTVSHFNELKEVHQALNSTLTKNIALKDKATQVMEDILRTTQEELQQTKNLLNKSQEQMKIMEERLSLSMEGQRKLQVTSTSCQSNLGFTTNKLQEIEQQKARCEENLMVTINQKQLLDQDLSQTRFTLQTTQNKLKDTENRLNRNMLDLSKEKSSLQQTSKNLQNIQKKEETMRSNFDSLNKKWKEAQTCVTSNCEAGKDGGRVHIDPFTFCPSGWRQINDRCYFFSQERKNRINSREDCERRAATLVKIDEEDDQLQEWIGQSRQSYWIGLSKDDNSLYRWPDNTILQVHFKNNFACVKASPDLGESPCAISLPWICEKPIGRCLSKESTLQCLGEKLEVIAKKPSP